MVNDTCVLSNKYAVLFSCNTGKNPLDWFEVTIWGIPRQGIHNKDFGFPLLRIRPNVIFKLQCVNSPFWLLDSLVKPVLEVQIDTKHRRWTTLGTMGLFWELKIKIKHICDRQLSEHLIIKSIHITLIKAVV